MADADELGIDDVLNVVTEIFGVDGTLIRDEIVCLCPVHEAGEEGHNPSCGVNVNTGLANCWSCPFAGDLLDFGVVALLNVSWEKREKRKIWRKYREQVRKILQPNEPDAIVAGVSRRVRAAKRAVNPRPVRIERSDILIPPLDAYRFRFPKDLRERGFTEETLHRWNIRYAREATLLKDDGKSFTLTHAIAIPIFSPDRELLGYCYRATHRSDSWFQNVRYIYTPKIQDTLNKLWYGMHLYAGQDVSEITVVEGALDAMWLDQIGYPTVAILGSQVKQIPKVRLLMPFKKVVIFTDRDLSGATTAYRLGDDLLKRGVPVDVVLYSKLFKDRDGKVAKDANAMCALDVELARERAVPYMLWRRSLRDPTSTE